MVLKAKPQQSISKINDENIEMVNEFKNQCHQVTKDKKL